MSCTYYLRDRKITNKIIDELKILEEDSNTKLNNLYEELNNKVSSILPINNENVIEKCRQYEPEYINETKFYYEENKSKYIIIDEYNREYTLDEFLKELNLKIM